MFPSCWCAHHTHTPGGGKKRWRREIMLINRSDTCRCTLLPNGHAPRNMHRILLSPTLPTWPTLHSCCGLWTRHPALPQNARGVYTSFTWNERQRFCNFFREKKEQVESAERMAETCPTKLLIILDWTRAPPALLSLAALRSQALIIKRPQWGRETESYKKLPVYDVSARRNH